MSEDQPSSNGADTPSNADDRRSQRDQISIDESHRLLVSERRRILLSYLTTRPGETVSRNELIDIIAEREIPHPGPGTHRDRIEADLHHVQLPKLADAEVIIYDPVAGAVQYNESETLESLLATSNEIENEERRL